MGAFTSLLGLGISAYGQYKSGQDAQAAAAYNQAIYQRQAGIIDVKKGLTKEQYDRSKKHLVGKNVTAVASSGYDLSGSFLEVINDNLTQANIDEQYALYNLEIEKLTALSSGEKEKRTGEVMAKSGTIGAVSDVLTEGNDWYQRWGGFGPTEEA